MWPRGWCEPREFDSVPAENVQRGIWCSDFEDKRVEKRVDKITVFVDSDFAGDPVSEKETGLVPHQRFRA